MTSGTSSTGDDDVDDVRSSFPILFTAESICQLINKSMKKIIIIKKKSVFKEYVSDNIANFLYFVSQIKAAGGGQVRPHPLSQWPRPPSQRERER